MGDFTARGRARSHLAEMGVERAGWGSAVGLRWIVSQMLMTPRWRYQTKTRCQCVPGFESYGTEIT